MYCLLLILIIFCLRHTYGYSILQTYNKSPLTRLTQSLADHYEITWDDGEIEWEDASNKKYNPPRFKSARRCILDGDCKEVIDDNINLQVCTITEDNEIHFNIDGIVNKSYMNVFQTILSKNKSKELVGNYDIILEDNIEFTIAVLILSVMIKELSEIKNITNHKIKNILTFTLIFVGVVLKGAKNAS